jgi:hypothetical protein
VPCASASREALIDSAGVVFLALAVLFFLLGAGAGQAWIEGPGRLTPLTARLFGSPMAGLALGLWLLARAERWREAFVPAVGMAIFGAGGTLALVAHRHDLYLGAPAGWAVILAPFVLLLIGAYLLLPARRAPVTSSVPGPGGADGGLRP